MAKTILIVDDAQTMRQMVGFTLKTAGYAIEEAPDGEAALDKLKNGLKVNLIITDLNMPRMDGITMIKGARTLPSCKYTPILLLTTESMEAKKIEGKNAGASGWIVKPFTPEHLLKVVKMFAP